MTLLTNLVPPYRSAAYDALHHRAVATGGGLRILCTQQREPQRNWSIPKPAFEHVTLPGVQVPLGENRTLAIPFGVKRTLMRKPTDVLILNGFGIAQWQAQNWAFNRGIPSILQFDGWSGSDAAYANPLRRSLRRAMIARAEGFIAASARGAEWFAVHGASSDHTSIAPIPPSFPVPDIAANRTGKERQYDIVWCGRTTTSKGFDVFMQTVEELSRAGIAKRIAIVGRTDIPKTKRLAASCGPGAQVEIFEQLAPDHLPPILTNGKITLFPSRNDAYGVGVVDAISCGSVALASPMTGCAPDILCGQEILPIDDPEVWTSACKRLLGNPELLESTRQHQAMAITQNTPDHHCYSIWQAVCQAVNRKADSRRWG
ncbi:glycosyltransferase family 4 protein [Thalassospira sp. HF15]|uniref:glycosyltransferase family 4 protein n=1 Tax=Thalassospira sp. HF15 TaxID=2722755 RepID=UPI0014317039